MPQHTHISCAHIYTRTHTSCSHTHAHTHHAHTHIHTHHVHTHMYTHIHTMLTHTRTCTHIMLTHTHHAHKHIRPISNKNKLMSPGWTQTSVSTVCTSSSSSSFSSALRKFHLYLRWLTVPDPAVSTSELWSGRCASPRLAGLLF